MPVDPFEEWAKENLAPNEDVPRSQMAPKISHVPASDGNDAKPIMPMVQAQADTQSPAAEYKGSYAPADAARQFLFDRETPTPSPKFRAGDTVMLRSGGPDMTVYEVGSEGIVLVEWFGEPQLRSGSFAPAQLVPVINPEGKPNAKRNRKP